MSPRLFDEWRSERRLKRALESYVAGLMTEPDPDDVAWLGEAACRGDLDRAAWELRYARRALGLIVAQRDALDDRTGSLVARELGLALQADRNVAPAMLKVSERQFNDRLTMYRDVLASRTPSEGTGMRLGRALLLIAGTARAADDMIVRGGDILARYVGESNEVLRKAFGAPSLPEDIPPSALGR
ncbi:MAG: hypothetical protein IT359_11180 [Gemmatimonadaceae bacterium]|nr:hypothetical protein [Gemmatimonadaceae bacterium]